MSNENYGVVKYESNEEASSGILIAEGEYPWQAIAEMIPTSRLGRTLEVARKYRSHLNEIAESWDGVNSYCLHTYLNFPYSKKKVNNKDVKYVDPDYNGEECKNTAMTPNSFPYSMDPKIGHYVVWSVDDINEDDAINFARKTLPCDEYELRTFVNPACKKSISKPHHIQIFSCPLSSKKN